MLLYTSPSRHIFYIQMLLYIFELKLLLLDTLIPMQFDINTRHNYELKKINTTLFSYNGDFIY